MGKGKLFGLMVATLLVGVLAATLVPAQSQGGGERLVLCEKNGRHDYEKDIDTDQDGDFSAGDMFLFSEPTYDKDGNRIGKTAGTGTVIREMGEDALISIKVSANLKGGRLEISGSLKGSNFADKPEFSVVGGTGRFAGAGGSLTVNERAGCGGFPRGDKIVVELN